jgi:1-acyl-sn-glycerol-3-phosphate acyltransferase
LSEQSYIKRKNLTSDAEKPVKTRPKIVNALLSAFVWIAFALTILLWLPLTALVRLLDRDPAHYATGRFFRWLAKPIALLGPSWRVRLDGVRITNPRRPYVVVANHQSVLDIPMLALAPFEYKWVAKAALFRVPVLGWMMRLAGDIPLDRSSTRSGVIALQRARTLLEQKCSVFFFPEGTRSEDRRVYDFSDGAFLLAVKQQVPILPMAIEGASDCLPKHSWIFGDPHEIKIHILPPVETAGLTKADVPGLSSRIRQDIIKQIAEWQGVPVEQVDAAGVDRPRAF